MTDERLMDLGRRAVACSAFRWMPGMVTLGGERLVLGFRDEDMAVVEPDGAVYDIGDHSWDTCSRHGHGDILPDMSDPATIGCVLALVREGCGSVDMHYYEDQRHTLLLADDNGLHKASSHGDSIGESLVIALELMDSEDVE